MYKAGIFSIFAACTSFGNYGAHKVPYDYTVLFYFTRLFSPIFFRDFFRDLVAANHTLYCGLSLTSARVKLASTSSTMDAVDKVRKIILTTGNQEGFLSNSIYIDKFSRAVIF